MMATKQRRMSTVNQMSSAQRTQHVQKTLKEIRKSRQGSDALREDRLPYHTPSRPLSPDEIAAARELRRLKEKPTLSLTKLDFELLREWNWKERQKRLETWSKDLGLSKDNIHFKEPPKETFKGGFTGKRSRPRSRPLKGPSTVTSRAILKREIEHITGLRVYAGNKPKNKKKKQQPRLPPLKVQINQRLPQGKKLDQRSGGPRTREVQKAPKKVPKPGLDSLMEMSSGVSVKKTFGKAWGEKGAAPVDKEKTSLSSLDEEKKPEIRKSSEEDEKAKEPLQPPTGIEDHGEVEEIQGETSVAPTPGRLRTDNEEEQPNTDYTTTRPISGQSRQAESPPSPGSSAGSIGLNDLFLGMHVRVDDGHKFVDDGEGPPRDTYKRPKQPTIYLDTVYGGMKFVPRGSVKPIGKLKDDYEYDGHLRDEDRDENLDQASEGGHPRKLKFFRPAGEAEEKARTERILAQRAARKATKQKKQDEKRRKEEERAERAAKLAEKAEHQAMARDAEKIFAIALRNLKLPKFQKGTLKDAENLKKFEKALLELPGVSSRWNVEEEAGNNEEGSNKPSKRTQYSRPGRRILYTPLPLTNKRFYRTNWKKIRYDVRHLMRSLNFWPKMWIAFEESHPKQLFELVRAKLTIKHFDKLGFNKDYDWSRGIHPDYVDWVLEDIVPHPGKYYYDKTAEFPYKEAVRRPSLEKDDIKLNDWFVKPPTYLPDSPKTPPFHLYDFCGYGDRAKPYFIPETLPREIMYFFRTPSKLTQAFEDIPKPINSFPGYMFKRWGRVPLDQKLPQYYPFPKRFSTWSMGQVGEPVRCNSTQFYLNDPYMRLGKNVYSPYHDEHARGYFLKKSVLDRLWSLGIINSKGDVSCSMEVFNRNRVFLRNYEWREEAMRRWESHWLDRQTTIKLARSTNLADMDWEGKKKDKKQKLINMQRIHEMRMAEREDNFKKSMEKKQKAMEALMRRRELDREEKRETLRQRRESTQERVDAVKMFDNLIQVQCKLWTDYKAKRAEETRREMYLEKVREREEKRREWWERHVESHNKKVMAMKNIQIKLQEEMKMKVDERKLEMRRKWREIPRVNLRRKERQERRKALVLKYIQLWRENVKKRKHTKVDARHISNWADGGNNLEESLKYLQEKSGHTGNLFWLAVVKAKGEEDEQRRRRTTSYDADDEDDEKSPEAIKLKEQAREEVLQRHKSAGYEGDIE